MVATQFIFIKCKQYGTHTRPPATATAIFRVSHGGVLHVGHIFTYISSHRERDQILQAGQKAKTIHATQLRAPRAICASRPSIILLELSNDTARTATANTILSQSFSRLAVLVAACVAKYVFSDFSSHIFLHSNGIPHSVCIFRIFLSRIFAAIRRIKRNGAVNAMASYRHLLCMQTPRKIDVNNNIFHWQVEINPNDICVGCFDAVVAEFFIHK